jgi:hypothetical protein
MDVTYYLSVLEAEGSFNTLYDLIHSDARAVVPRDAAVGWYRDYFAPRGASPSVITGIEFGSWTWGVTGVTYPNTAAVYYSQEFWDDGQQNIEGGVVHLVQDEDGSWRWFFGSSREFVDEMIATYVAAQPVDTPTSIAVADIGGFWNGLFSYLGLAYDAPEVLTYQGSIDSICGWTQGGPASYCASSHAIYIDEDWYWGTVEQIGDFAWVTILAHEWGHHVQYQLYQDGIVHDSPFAGPVERELEADCFAGVYAQDAEWRGLLDSGDIEEAAAIAAASGDISHGSGEDRRWAFMSGYTDGLAGCGVYF